MERYVDAAGCPLGAGDRVQIAGWAEARKQGKRWALELSTDEATGKVHSISDPDGDADSEGRAIGIPPSALVEFDSGNEERYVGSWQAKGWWDEDAPYEFEDLVRIDDPVVRLAAYERDETELTEAVAA